MEVLARSGDRDVLGAAAEGVLPLIGEAGVEGVIGAGRFERGADRRTWRDGSRGRTLETRLGPLSLKVPKSRIGSGFPGVLEPRRTVETAPVSGIQEAWIAGVPPRKVDGLVQAMGLSGISTSSVSRLCKDVDERAGAFLQRPLEGEWPHLWLKATHLKVRKGGRVVPVAARIGRRSRGTARAGSWACTQGPPEAGPFWTTFLRDLATRGLRGVARVIAEAPEGREAAIPRLLGAVLLEQADDGQPQPRHRPLEAMAELAPPPPHEIAAPRPAPHAA